MDQPSREPDIAERHRLEISEVELIGGDRRVHFRPGFNVIQGDISSGKTTLVRLMRAMLVSMPKNLPPEVRYLQAIRGQFIAGIKSWQVYRPAVTTRDAVVEITEKEDPAGANVEVLRLPILGAERNYSSFLLDHLEIPNLRVPQRRRDPNSPPVPLTINDWLSYCIITGDELDTQIFGHQHEFRDRKRRYIFEIAYGYHNPELFALQGELRNIELALTVLDRDASIRQKFLVDTPFADISEIERRIADLESELQTVTDDRSQIQSLAEASLGTESLRSELLSLRQRSSELVEGIARVRAQLRDLEDLRSQLTSQSAQMTRAIVAGEWLVDFDFILCPRCGNDVDSSHSQEHTCYLCGQETSPAPSTNQLLAEQDRITSQLVETDDVLSLRRESLEKMVQNQNGVESRIQVLATELDRISDSFISDNANRLENLASQRARIETRILQLKEYRELLYRYSSKLEGRFELEARYADTVTLIENFERDTSPADSNVRALEARLLSYLQELGIPELGTSLSVEIHPTDYLPRISGRRFDTLSSQGLKTLVNIAHSLAHHTVAIDRGLPIPGLLILDGLSSNAGHEGFDHARVRDVYRLLRRVSQEYEGSLQVIAVDNEVSHDIVSEFIDDIVLTLTQQNRLLRIPSNHKMSS